MARFITIFEIAGIFELNYKFRKLAMNHFIPNSECSFFDEANY